jgi:hypothetical protein
MQTWKMHARRELGLDVLTGMALQIDYELDMLAALPAHVIAFDRDGPAELKNACLESALLHARILIEFLGGRNRNDLRDIRWDDYCGSPFFPKGRFASWLDVIDPYLAHLSLSRADAKQAALPDYFLTDLADGLIEEAAAFASVVASERSPCASVFAAAVSKAHERRLHSSGARWPVPSG